MRRSHKRTGRVIEREDEGTIREKLGNAAHACSDNIKGGELIT